jgi:hypothetical protein
MGNIDAELAKSICCERYPEECGERSLTLIEAAKHFVKSMREWHTQGRPVVPEEVFAQRKATCLVCDHWRGWHSGEIGYCSICKCGAGRLSLKLKMATEKCPKDKWGVFTVASSGSVA